MSLSKKIRAIRTKAGMTQEEFGKILGLSPMAVSQWENDRAVPRMGSLQKICDNFDVQMGDLLDEEPNPRSVFRNLPENALIVEPSEDVMVPVKVVGTVHAGDPDEGFAATDIAPLPKTIWERHKSSFALQARGWCMDNVFSDQSIVFVDPDMQPRDNSICVFLLDGTDTVVRRLRVGSAFDMLTPDSHDKSIEDIIVKKDGTRECVCQGVVFFYQAPREME
jgi:repressor LexA